MALASSSSLQAAALGFALPSHARQYAPLLLAAAKKHYARSGLSLLRFLWLYAAVISHETAWGMAPGFEPKGDPGGRGDNGHGYGFPQIDDRTWGAWLATANWRDPAVQLDKGASILADALQAFGGNERPALAAYNAGAGAVRKAIARGQSPDSVTWSAKHGLPGYSTFVYRQLNQLETRGRKAPA